MFFFSLFVEFAGSTAAVRNNQGQAGRMTDFAVRMFQSLASIVEFEGGLREHIVHLLIIEEAVKRMVNFVNVCSII